MKDCLECGYTCRDLAEKAKNNRYLINRCPYLSDREKEYLTIALNAKEILPEVPMISSTVKTKTGLIVGDRNSPVLVTANFPYTQVVIGEVLAKAGISCNILIIDTDGYSVDMAVYLKIFNGERVKDAIESCNEIELIEKRILVIPGLARDFKKDIEEKTKWDVLVGPICAAEIPIYLLKEGLI